MNTDPVDHEHRLHTMNTDMSVFLWRTSGRAMNTDMSAFMGLSPNKDLKNGLIRAESVFLAKGGGGGGGGMNHRPD